MVGTEQREPFHPLVLLLPCPSPQQSASLAGAAGKLGSRVAIMGYRPVPQLLGWISRWELVAVLCQRPC